MAAKVVLFILLFAAILVVALLVAVETGWAKNQLRGLLVRQANRYLTARLEIDSLGGSLFRGLELGGIRLTREGETIVDIASVVLSYSPRELWQNGIVIRRVTLTRPVFNVARQADGRWNVSALVRRDTKQEERTGPGQPIQVLDIQIVDGRVSLAEDVAFGAAHVPRRFDGLNMAFSFDYVPVSWRLNFQRVSWSAPAPDLTVTLLSGGLGRGPGGWTFDRFHVETRKSAFTMQGRIVPGEGPTRFGLDVHADRFAFQEWAGVLRGLRNIAVEAGFDVALTGSTKDLHTNLRLAGTGGAITGAFVLDTSVPGWHGAGAVDVDTLNLARWLDRQDRPSDISGHVTFDLDLDLGGHFPRGRYAFKGRRARFMDYEAANVDAHGRLTAVDALVDKATATAYGAPVVVDGGSIGLDEPFFYQFRGSVAGVDLRNVPKRVPVPHVESALTFTYDVSGTFSEAYIAGGATFERSTFLGATISPGMAGTIDTSATPITYSGDGAIDGVSLARFGEGLDVAWMRNPRYAGVVSGRFHVDGSGSDAASLTLKGGGRLARADLFQGHFSDADVTIDIADGTLHSSFNGRFAAVDPAVAFDEPRMAALLNGTADVQIAVRDLLTATPAIADYDLDGRITLDASTIRGFDVTRAAAAGGLHDGMVTLSSLDVSGPAIEGRGSGSIALAEGGASDFEYDIVRASLPQLEPVLSWKIADGDLVTRGRLRGPSSALNVSGDATLSRFSAGEMGALTAKGTYSATIAGGDMQHADGRVEGDATFVTLFGQTLQQASGTVALKQDRVTFDLRAVERENRTAALVGSADVSFDERRADIHDLAITLGATPWRLAQEGASSGADQARRISWTDTGIAVESLLFVRDGGASDERIPGTGKWKAAGGGALHVSGSRVQIATLAGAFEQPPRYTGIAEVDLTLEGSRREPILTGQIAVTNGTMRRFSYERLAGKVNYTGGRFGVDFRIDQSPTVWITAVGTVPYALFDRSQPEEPIQIKVTSSAIGLGLLEGLTDVVSNVTGQLRVDVDVVGTTNDPHFMGSVDIQDAAFLVTSTGERYKNGRARFNLSTDRVGVEGLRVEDANGHAIDVSGSLGTHELRVGDVQIDVRSDQFELVRNRYGRVAVNARLQVRGRFEQPRIAGDLDILAGELRVDEILTRALFQPYATVPTSIANVDPLAALNPWDRLGLDISLRVPETLRFVGEDVQIAAGTPIGLGNINLRAGGDLYLYKDPGQPLSVTGSLDRMSGTYAFQGRRFDIDRAGSSINFRGDLNPELYVSVLRTISGVETKVTVSGLLKEPELQLASTPPLDASDILSLIIFNTQANELTATQQSQLAVRAGTLAASFMATPLVSAIQNELHLETLQVEAGDFGNTAKLTVGQEIWPGLVARFSRQFGPEPYDEATIEYYLSRILRLRATFSDAASLNTRALFRRTERAGIDLLVFFSF